VGDLITVVGRGFGNDPLDICVLIRGEDGNVVAFSRAETAQDTQLTVRVNAIVPGETSGTIVATRGSGQEFFPQNLPENIILRDPGTWVWVPNGGLTTRAAQPITLAPGGGAGAQSCTSFYGTVTPVGTAEVTLPVGTTCPANTEFIIQADANSTTGNLIFDYFAPMSNTTALPLVACANALCGVFQQAFFQAAGILISCTTQVSPGGDVTIVVSAPPGDTFLNGGVWVQICTP